ncbi:MAG: universal stress protein [Ilumatobacteraceae bacterium]
MGAPTSPRLGNAPLVCSLDASGEIDPSVEELERHLSSGDHRTLRLSPGRWRRQHPAIDGAAELPADPVRAILRTVETGGHDIVVVRHSAAWPPRWIRRLIHESPCSILVQRTRPPAVVDVLAAVGLGDDAADHSRHIVEQAAAIADRLGGDTHLIHGWDQYDALATRGTATFTPAEETADVAASAEADRRRALDAFAAGVDHVDAGHAHLAHGPVAEVVEAAVDRHPYAMVVVGASSRTGIEGRLRVSTPVDILGLVQCSVLVVKPPTP